MGKISEILLNSLFVGSVYANNFAVLSCNDDSEVSFSLVLQQDSCYGRVRVYGIFVVMAMIEPFRGFRIFSRKYFWNALELRTSIKHNPRLLSVDWYIFYGGRHWAP